MVIKTNQDGEEHNVYYTTDHIQSAGLVYGSEY